MVRWAKEPNTKLGVFSSPFFFLLLLSTCFLHSPRALSFELTTFPIFLNTVARLVMRGRGSSPGNTFIIGVFLSQLLMNRHRIRGHLQAVFRVSESVFCVCVCVWLVFFFFLRDQSVKSNYFETGYLFIYFFTQSCLLGSVICFIVWKASGTLHLLLFFLFFLLLRTVSISSASCNF